MVDYRTKLLPNIQKNIQKSYTRLYEQYPAYGLFGKPTQKKLLRDSEYDNSKYGAQFWSITRKSIQRGLIDISLFCNIANSDQLEKTIFNTLEVPIPGTAQSTPKHLLPYLMTAALHQNQNEKIENWKIDMANRILSEIFEFYRKSKIVNSKTYLRMLDEVEDFLNIEIARRYKESAKNR